MIIVAVNMRIDIWSDYICPFCTVGERHLSLALDGFEGRDDVEIVWRSFQLGPTAPKEGVGTLEHLTRAKNMSEQQVATMNDDLAARAVQVGLEYNWRDAYMTNTYDLHRLGHLARERGVGNEWDAAVKQAFFTDGKDLSQREVLHEIGASIGLNAQDLNEVLDSDQYADSVQEEIDMARQIGVQGVPFFVFNNKLAVSGAQPVEVFKQALAQA